jgi:hypothetical protein
MIEVIASSSTVIIHLYLNHNRQGGQYMKQKINCYIKTTLLLSILAIGMLIQPRICFAANKTAPKGIVSLKAGTVYHYDLDGDGKTEKIQYKVTENDDAFIGSIKLYVNDKLLLSKKEHGFYYKMQICDLDTNDSYLDLYITMIEESDCIKSSFFTRYHNGKLFNTANFKPSSKIKDFSAVRYDISKLTGNGKFYAMIDTPSFSDAIGCYCCYMPFQLKGHVITPVPQKTYQLVEGRSKYQYKVKKSFQAYEKADSKKAVYSVKKGDKVTFDLMYVTKSGNLYFRMINSKGKSGWINSKQKDFPMWG